MRSKSLTAFVTALVLCHTARAETPPPPRFLGSQSCSTSGCHGGAKTNRDQFLVWSKKDFHSRSYATLTIARSQRIAETLRIADPRQNARCTVCHTPFQAVPESARAPSATPTEGVSCESCHGTSDFWLRTHTRPDYTHADRVTAGMRDLKNLYVRANTCVACHQNVDTNLVFAGHPELIFELDGQCVTEPKHWREAPNWSGAQAWLVGQAVALRELSWQLAREPQPTDRLKARWSGLLWVLQQADDTSLPSLAPLEREPSPGNATKAQTLSDELARHAAAIEWSADRSRRVLARLAATGPAFADAAIPQEVQARRAERLVLALDRLVGSLPPDAPATRTDLDRLFSLVQSLPDFDPRQFSESVRSFDQTLSQSGSPK